MTSLGTSPSKTQVRRSRSLSPTQVCSKRHSVMQRTKRMADCLFLMVGTNLRAESHVAMFALSRLMTSKERRATLLFFASPARLGRDFCARTTVFVSRSLAPATCRLSSATLPALRNSKRATGQAFFHALHLFRMVSQIQPLRCIAQRTISGE